MLHWISEDSDSHWIFFDSNWIILDSVYTELGKQGGWQNYGRRTISRSSTKYESRPNNKNAFVWGHNVNRERTCRPKIQEHNFSILYFQNHLCNNFLLEKQKEGNMKKIVKSILSKCILIWTHYMSSHLNLLCLLFMRKNISKWTLKIYSKTTMVTFWSSKCMFFYYKFKV